MADRLFRLVLKLLPEEFRAGYAEDLEAAFRAERREARESRRWGAVLQLWLATLADIARHAPREHLTIAGRDLRFAWRRLASRPAHAAAAVLTLGVGIGANVAMFAVVDAVLLAPLPYAHPDALVSIAETESGADPSNLGYLTFVDLRNRSRQFASMAAVNLSTATLTGNGHDAERVNAMRASRTYFEMLGVAPALGRAFTEAEDRPGAARRVTILAESLWRRRFNSDPGIIGQPILLSGTPFVVVGVLPAGFRDLIADRLYGGAELWTPLGYDPAASFACRTCRHLRVFGRLAPGATPDSATSELGGIIASLEKEHPTEYHEAGVQVARLSDVFLGPVRPVLLVLWIGVGVLLLVACGNVANLMLLGATERAHEVLVRAALGVTRRRLVRQLVTESLLVAAGGALIGLAIGTAGVAAVHAVALTSFPRLADAAVNGRTLLLAVGLATACAVLAGLAPLRLLLDYGSSTSLLGNRGRTASVGVWRARSALVAANVAMATVLVVGSGLLVRSLDGLLAVSPGFDPSGVLTLKLWATGPRFNAGSNEQQIAVATTFYDEVLGDLRTLPGVTGAAAVTTLPLGGGVDGYGLHIDGRPEANPEAAPSADRFVVAGDFFNVLRIPLERGRLLDDRDRQGSEPVVVINETMATKLFPGADPLGHRIRLGPTDADARTIVGVVGDVTHHGLDVPVGYQVYVPQSQWAWAETLMTLVVRAADPRSIGAAARDVLRRIDPAQPLTDVRLYADIVGDTIGERRFAARLLSVFALTALLLSAIGLYGALAVTVGQRTREIGIRVALGAPARAVRRLVLGQGFRPVSVGLIGGLLVAAVAGVYLRSLLYQVPERDPLTFAMAAALVAGCGLLACLPPAARAARVDPVETLRAE